MTKPNHTIKEIFELGEKRTQGFWIDNGNEVVSISEPKTGSVAGSFIDENSLYVAAAPSMEYYLREAMELLQNAQETLHSADAVWEYEDTVTNNMAINNIKETLAKVDKFIKQAGAE